MKYKPSSQPSLPDKYIKIDKKYSKLSPSFYFYFVVRGHISNKNILDLIIFRIFLCKFTKTINDFGKAVVLNDVRNRTNFKQNKFV